MKVRTKKLLSILLAASMVFSMNTFAFGEEPAADGGEPSEEVSIATETQEQGYAYGMEVYNNNENDNAYSSGYNDGVRGFEPNPVPSYIPYVDFEVSDEWMIGYEAG